MKQVKQPQASLSKLIQYSQLNQFHPQLEHSLEVGLDSPFTIAENLFSKGQACAVLILTRLTYLKKKSLVIRV